MEQGELMMKIESGARTSTDGIEEYNYGFVFGRAGTTIFDPERKLLAAVLEQALEDLARPKLHSAAVEWLLGERSDSLFDFASVCEALGLDPGAVRDAVLERRKDRIRGNG